MKSSSETGGAAGAVAPRAALSSDYLAFISYSHVDQAIARRLQNFIERFRHVASDGAKPGRLGRCFRDEDELAGGGLTPQIEQALSRSRALIVVCTPTASRSQWVALEIDTYRRLHPEGKIIALWFDEAKRDGQVLPGSLNDLDLFVPEQINFGEAGLFDRAVAALLDEPVDVLVGRQQALLRKEQQQARRTLAAGIALSLLALAGIGASLWLGWRNTLARSELIASNAQLAWDGHNGRLAGLLAISASHGEQGFMPEAALIHPLLVDVLASPTLPLGVYSLEANAGSASLRYNSDGSLVLMQGDVSNFIVRGIRYDTMPSADRYVPAPSEGPCVLPPPEPSPLSGDEMEWAATPGCHYAYAIDGFGAEFSAGPSYTRVSAGGRFRGEVNYVEFSPAGSLATTHGDGGITFVVSLHPSEIQVSQANTGISAVGFAADDLFLALGQEDGAVRLWVQEDGFSPRESDLIYGAPISAGPVRAIAFAPGNSEFAVLYAEGVVARFRNEVFAAHARRISSGRIRDFPYMDAPVLFSSDGRAAWINDGNLGVIWRSDVDDVARIDDANLVRDSERRGLGRVDVFAEPPVSAAFMGHEIAVIDDGEIFFIGGGSTTRLPEHLAQARVIGACSDETILAATETALYEMRPNDGAVSRSWAYSAGDMDTAACTDGDRVVVRKSDGLVAIGPNSRETLLRRISASEQEPSAAAIAMFNHRSSFIARGEENILLVGDVHGARVERIVVGADAHIVGYGVTPDEQFAIVGAQYGLESAPCVEWRLLHLPTRTWLKSVEQGRPGNVYCARLAVADARIGMVHWLTETGNGYSTPLPSRREAWRSFCTLAHTWSFTSAERAAFGALVSPNETRPCRSLGAAAVQAPTVTPTTTPAPTQAPPPTPATRSAPAAASTPSSSAAGDARPPGAPAPQASPQRRAPIIFAPAPVPQPSGALFDWPAAGRSLLHPGEGEDQRAVFFDNPVDGDVRAAADGEVVYADFTERWSGLILIKHDDNVVTVYGYLGGTIVVPGDPVRRGDVIGRTDSRARLFFQVRRGQAVEDPAPYFAAQ